jgi:branched-chain amino acid aminotransferase
MLDHLGAVAECTGANLFAVIDGKLVTPTTRSALPGITRRTVMELFDVEERDVWPTELYVADSAFVTGSGAGIVEVAEVDGRRLPGSPLVAEVAEAYRAATRDPRFRVEI